jgi:hypothetical protein
MNCSFGGRTNAGRLRQTDHPARVCPARRRSRFRLRYRAAQNNTGNCGVKIKISVKLRILHFSDHACERLSASSVHRKLSIRPHTAAALLSSVHQASLCHRFWKMPTPAGRQPVFDGLPVRQPDLFSNSSMGGLPVPFWRTDFYFVGFARFTSNALASDFGFGTFSTSSVCGSSRPVGEMLFAA